MAATATVILNNERVMWEMINNKFYLSAKESYNQFIIDCYHRQEKKETIIIEQYFSSLVM